MVSASLAGSDKFDALPSDQTRLFYILLLTNADAEGRVEAHAGRLRAQCFPLRDDVTKSDVEQHLVALAHTGLVNLYTVDGKRYLEVADFHRHNTIYRYTEADAKKPRGLPSNKQVGDPRGEANSTLPAPSEGSPANAATGNPTTGTQSEKKPHKVTKSELRKVEGKGKSEEQHQPQGTTVVSSSRQPAGGTPIPDADDFREAPDPMRPLRELPKRDKEAAIRLEQVATGKKRWTTAQKAEASAVLLEDRERAMNALNRTFDLLDGLEYPFAFFKKALEQPAIATVQLPDKGTDDFERMIAAAMEGDLDAVQKFSN